MTTAVAVVTSSNVVESGMWLLLMCAVVAVRIA